MEAILKKANELGHLLKRHEIVKRFRELTQKLENTPASRELLEEFAQTSQEFQHLQQLGQELSEEQKTQVQELEQKVRDDALINEFIATQNYYMQLLDQVNQIIANPQGDPPPEASGIIVPEQNSNIILP